MNQVQKALNIEIGKYKMKLSQRKTKISSVGVMKRGDYF